jgi:hypothetical protein
MFKYSRRELRPVRTELSNIQAGVFLADCNDDNLPAILFAMEELTEVDEFTVELDILQEFTRILITIPKSLRMRPLILPRRLRVRSCRRIGRKRNHFHETNVTLAVDLTAGLISLGLR